MIEYVLNKSMLVSAIIECTNSVRSYIGYFPESKTSKRFEIWAVQTAPVIVSLVTEYHSQWTAELIRDGF